MSPFESVMPKNLTEGGLHQPTNVYWPTSPLHMNNQGQTTPMNGGTPASGMPGGVQTVNYPGSSTPLPQRHAGWNPVAPQAPAPGQRWDAGQAQGIADMMRLDQNGVNDLLQNAQSDEERARLLRMFASGGSNMPGYRYASQWMQNNGYNQNQFINQHWAGNTGSMSRGMMVPPSIMRESPGLAQQWSQAVQRQPAPTSPMAALQKPLIQAPQQPAPQAPQPAFVPPPVPAAPRMYQPTAPTRPLR